MPAVPVVLGGRLAAMAMGCIYPVIVVMVVLVDGDGVSDVADLMSVPSGRRCGHAKRDHYEREYVPDESKSWHHSEGPSHRAAGRQSCR